MIRKIEGSCTKTRYKLKKRWLKHMSRRMYFGYKNECNLHRYIDHSSTSSHLARIFLSEKEEVFGKFYCSLEDENSANTFRQGEVHIISKENTEVREKNPKARYGFRIGITTSMQRMKWCVENSSPRIEKKGTNIAPKKPGREARYQHQKKIAKPFQTILVPIPSRLWTDCFPNTAFFLPLSFPRGFSSISRSVYLP